MHPGGSAHGACPRHPHVAVAGPVRGVPERGLPRRCRRGLRQPSALSQRGAAVRSEARHGGGARRRPRRRWRWWWNRRRGGRRRRRDRAGRHRSQRVGRGGSAPMSLRRSCPVGFCGICSYCIYDIGVGFSHHGRGTTPQGHGGTGDGARSHRGGIRTGQTACPAAGGGGQEAGHGRGPSPARAPPSSSCRSGQAIPDRGWFGPRIFHGRWWLWW